MHPKYFRHIESHTFPSSHPDIEHRGYTKLYDTLWNTKFTYLIDLDENRAAEGIELRRDFCHENGITIKDCENDSADCSVMEMLVALSIRSEMFLTGNGDEDHPETVFWMMIDNLGLGGMTDDCFDEQKVESVLRCFLLRKYSKSGQGSPFPVKNSSIDMRKIQIWYQLNAYIMDNEPQEDWTKLDFLI